MKKRSSPDAPWQAILSLSKSILELQSPEEKIRTLEKFTNELLSCKTKITLTATVFSESVENPQEEPTPPSSASTFDKGQSNPLPTTVTVPISVSDSILGEICCRRDDPPFGNNDIALINGLATQASIIIENIRLQDDSRQQAVRMATVSEISNAISSILDLDLLLSSIASLIHKYFNYQYVYVFTVHMWQKKIQLRAGSYVDLNLDPDNSYCDFGDNNDILSQAIEQRQVILSGGINYETNPFQLPPKVTHSELVIPLCFGEQVLGLLWLRSEQEKAFNQSDVNLFGILGDNIAVALRNANLYQSEQWRRQVAESMRDVAGLLSAEVDLEHLLNQLLAELTKTLPSETAAIWLVENSVSEADTGQIASPLQLAALLTPNDSLHDLIDQLETSPVDQWLTDILESHYPLVRDNLTADDPFGQLFGYPENYSAIFSSLRVGLQPIGILVLAHPQSSRYGREAQLIVSTFASYAAVAIKNTQLYEAAHDQAWVSTVLLQMSEATQSIDNLDELIQTIVHTIPQLVGVNACAILLWDKKVEAFIPSASFGITPEQKAYFDQWYIFENDIPAFDQILATKEPVILTSSMLSPVDESELYASFNLERSLFVLFPMVSQTDIQGAILVDFSENSSEYDYKLWEEKLSIIQGIAHQTAMAVENINLIRSQEEEAYVSIALLQVAQAIVSTTEINDVLGVITRITPILVAMRRCAIFLWDFQRNAFYLSQSYGIPRPDLTDLSAQFSPPAFPMLESVRQSNQIACYLIDNDSFSVSDWVTLKPDEYLLVNQLFGADDTDVTLPITKEVLSSRQNLLFAYPLSVKGAVLGIMITEEEFSERGTPSYNIRERRMEIVTGITQQTALAIQNDLFQREALQRERFDRELQLAREIQRNFMPDSLPQLQGWELDVRWKPARQVGGDYYDIFELPGGNIGLVIADVADKGMPAALFMTLVRTLLRAAVRDNLSPADTLKEVNDLLVPDAKNGMFVTITYGILSPENGSFIYANAGHVPPLLISHEDKSLLELLPSSMAIGVLTEITIGERQIQLTTGDTLIFYTDGVSEAFSPDGDMYGNERLKQLVLENPILSASELLDSIVTTIDEFTDSATMSDDLTLIALHRKLSS